MLGCCEELIIHWSESPSVFSIFHLPRGVCHHRVTGGQTENGVIRCLFAIKQLGVFIFDCVFVLQKQNRNKSKQYIFLTIRACWAQLETKMFCRLQHLATQNLEAYLDMTRLIMTVPRNVFSSARFWSGSRRVHGV